MEKILTMIPSAGFLQRCGRWQKNWKRKGLEHPSYFEFLYGMGMLAFEENDAEYIVLETGLGGRLDATNSFEHPFLSSDHIDRTGSHRDPWRYD